MRDPYIKKTVDGETYEIWTFPPSKALKIGTRLSKLVGEPLGELARAFNMKGKSSLADADIDTDVLGKAVQALFENLDEDVVLNTVREIAEEARDSGGREIKFDGDHYRGKTLHLLKVVKAVLEVNYSDFLEGLSGLGDLVRRVQAMQAESGETRRSTGGSGE